MANGNEKPSKRTESVKVSFDERLFLDLNREAIKRDRKLSDLIYQISRQWLNGNRIPDPSDDESAEMDRDAL